MTVHTPNERPESWRARRGALDSPWMIPFAILEYPFAWLAYLLSCWSFLQVLDYLGSFSVLVAVIFYFSGSGSRLMQKHYQAWQVINTAQGKGGSGGRIDALQELNMDGVPLIGVDVSGAFLQGVRLPRAKLERANFNAVDARNSNFEHADFTTADLTWGNFRNGNLSYANLRDSNLENGDFCSANLKGADFSGVTLDGADLGNTDLANIKWQQIKSVKGASLQQARNAPQGFLQWAAEHGAMTTGRNSDCP